MSRIPESELVTVKTTAIGVNYADCCVRWGIYASAKEYVATALALSVSLSCGKGVAVTAVMLTAHLVYARHRHGLHNVFCFALCLLACWCWCLLLAAGTLVGPSPLALSSAAS